DVRRARFDLPGAPGARVGLVGPARPDRLHAPLDAAAQLRAPPARDEAVERGVRIPALRPASTRATQDRIAPLPPVVGGPEGVRTRPAAVAARGVAVGPAQVVDGVVPVARHLAAG